MMCPMCGGVGAIRHKEFPEGKVILPRKLTKYEAEVLKAVHFITEDMPELQGLHAEHLTDYFIGMGPPYTEITYAICLDSIVKLVELEMLQLLTFAEAERGDWLPTVVCTENGQLVAEKLEAGNE